MAVNWDCSNVRDYKELHDNEYEWALTQAFLVSNWGYGWFDILGIGAITQSNVGEVWARVSILQGMGIIGMTGARGAKKEITEADITRRIGLSSNYSTITRTKWISEKLKKCMDLLAEDVLKRLEKVEQPA